MNGVSESAHRNTHYNGEIPKHAATHKGVGNSASNLDGNDACSGARAYSVRRNSSRKRRSSDSSEPKSPRDDVEWRGKVGKTKAHDWNIINDCKRRCRGDLRLREWTKQGYSWTSEPLKFPSQLGHIAREHAKTLSKNDFIEKYEKFDLPVIIDGIVDEWPAKTRWEIEEIYEKYRHRKFKCGEDDDGRSVRIKMKYFLRYMAEQRDDSPMYIFDSSFDDDSKAQGILSEYSVPVYFNDDLFSLVGERKRPPYRWFLVGPERSGTAPHIDPLATSAWNTLTKGYKRWVLMPPGVPRAVAKGKGFKKPGEDDEPIDFFTNMLPRIKAKFPHLPIIECVQRPGETLFIPGGWWHGVLNLTDTVAVTQNFCSRTNFKKVWRATRTGRRNMARKWLALLEKHHPDLADTAKRYGIMYYFKFSLCMPNMQISNFQAK
eukprot:gb/GECG01003779.1/.p1 GENE.gb/GECG01003779.1/~~gb/GECG01003779.1/.p1  ORF type:complete len:432 (+),score=35.55 gb/GECG01003779.1/:1-1296(+)